MTTILCDTKLPNISSSHIDKMAPFFQCLSDKGRLTMVIACLDGEKTVSQLMEITQYSQSLTSHNLRALRHNRILKSRRQGRHMVYSIDDDHVRHIITDLAHHSMENCP